LSNGSINESTITFGDGASDTVVSGGDTTNDVITFGHGAGDWYISVGNMTNDVITFADVAVVGNAPDGVASNGNISNSKITFGNGDGDSVTVFGGGSNDTIIMGNGNHDQVGILGLSSGGDKITTGTGAGDTVQVGTHTNADTFGFALGTNDKSFTTVYGPTSTAQPGAQAGDHVISGNNLGSNVVPVSGPFTNGTFNGLSDFFSFVTAHSPASGNTYIGHSTTDTLIVTDYHGQFGAVDIVGIFNHSTAAGHILTLA
jgi:hypothetical protein